MGDAGSRNRLRMFLFCFPEFDGEKTEQTLWRVEGFRADVTLTGWGEDGWELWLWFLEVGTMLMLMSAVWLKKGEEETNHNHNLL